VSLVLEDGSRSGDHCACGERGSRGRALLGQICLGPDALAVFAKDRADLCYDTATGRIQYFPSPLVPALPFINDGKLQAPRRLQTARLPVVSGGWNGVG
jgi:hypothetical protein